MSHDDDRARVALVTGANRGLGAAVCARLHQLGHRVVVAARKHSDAVAAARALGGGAQPVELDVADPASVRRAGAAVGPVDILVNNAGVLLDAEDRPSRISLDVVEHTLSVNALGAWRVTQAFLPAMVDRGWGRVVMVSSGTGAFSNGLFVGAPAYSLSKVALNAVTVLFAAETAGTGVLVNAVNPGLVRTRMRPDATRGPDDAAQDIVTAVTLPDGGPHGVFLRHGRPAAW